MTLEIIPGEQETSPSNVDDLTPTAVAEPKREHDILGTYALQNLQILDDRARKTPCHLDLRKVLWQHHNEDSISHTCRDQLPEVRERVDWKQSERGQNFFYRYALAHVTGFAMQGVVGENPMTPDTVEVRIRTGSFSSRSPPDLLLRHLIDTFQWLLQTTRSVDNIKPGGEGHVSTIQVRLLHIRVHQRIMHLVLSRSEYYNGDVSDPPVNALHSIHAIAVFYCNPIWPQPPRLGITPTAQETPDDISFFRYIAYLLGTPDLYSASVPRAKATTGRGRLESPRRWLPVWFE